MNHSDPGRLFLSGPVIVLVLLSGLAILALLAIAFGRVETLARLGDRAAARLEQGRAIPTLWGLVASIFLLAASAVLFSTKVLALLGVLLLTACLALASFGLGVAALSLGQRLANALGSFELETLPAARLGLWILFLAAFLPFLGWILVLLSLAAGIGSALEALVTGRRGQD